MPYFEKMAQADIFVLLTQCQFEKNGFQNRCKVNGKWWTNPVVSGLTPIVSKHYTDGQSLLELNTFWIITLAKTLGIDIGKIKQDFPTDKKGTDRIIEICKHYKADEYLTNPEAISKYLDEKKLNDNGIRIVPFKSTTDKHVFELFGEIGIEQTRKMLCKTSNSFSAS